MTDASVTGVDGHVLKLKKFHSILLSDALTLKTRYEEIQQMQARDDDILICGYPKCGTHWVWEVVAMLVKNSTEYARRTKSAQMLEMSVVDMAMITNIPSPRLLNTHLPFSFLPPDSIKKRNKIIYLLRNPKDVAVSYYNHIQNIHFYDYKGSWDSYLRIFLEGKGEYGSYFKYIKQWEQDMKDHPEIPIITIYFEDLKQDFMKEIRRLCEFLEITRDDPFLRSVYDACTFDKLKHAKGRQMRIYYREGTSLFRKGEIGDWKNWFTVAQNEVFDNIANREMNELGLNNKFKLKSML